MKAANRSPRTVDWTIPIVQRFFAYLQTAGLGKPINQIGPVDLISFILHLQDAPRWPGKPGISDEKRGKLSPHSIQAFVRAIKAFWSWMLKDGFIDENPLMKFPLPTAPKNIVKTLEPEQIKAMLKEIDRQTATGTKYYLAVVLFLDTGIRLGELVGIKMAEVDMAGGLVKVIGKGQKERIVPFTTFTRKQLLQYLKHFRGSLCEHESPYLFPRSDGEHISASSVQQYLRRLAGKAGLQGVKVSPHRLRHTFASAYVAKGGSDLALKEILGHASIQSTQIYVHLQPQHLQQMHGKLSPVEDLVKG